MSIEGEAVTCPAYAPIFGYLGVAACSCLANFGSAWGTWRAGIGLCKMGVDYPRGIMKNLVPIVMAGVLGIYGLIVSVIITQGITKPVKVVGDDGLSYGAPQYSLYTAYAHLAAGLCCGISCLAAGGTIGYIGDVGIQCFGLKVSGGKRSWDTEGSGDGFAGNDQMSQEAANKLYVGLLIMLIFSEALALYGMIVALLLCQGKDIACDY